VKTLSLFGFLATALAAVPAASQTTINLPDSLYTAGDTIAWVMRVPTFCEGPAWEASTGTVYFTRQYGNNVAQWPILNIRPGVDTGSVLVAEPMQANGLAFDPQKRLVAAQNGRLTRYASTGAVDTVLTTSGTNGVTFNRANDLSFGSNGGVYFTALGTAVYYLSPSRQLTVATNSATSANGIEWIEEDSAVYVNEQANIHRYRVNPDGSLTNPTVFTTVSGINADGGTVDIHGNRYVANYAGGDLRVFNANGDSIGIIVPRLVTGTSFDASSGNRGDVSNAVFGGPDMKTLYITGDGGLFAIRLKVAGRPSAVSPTSLRAALAARKTAPTTERSRDVMGRMIPAETPAAVVRVPTPGAH
jgi:sugar lactone lactonase YvrE